MCIKLKFGKETSVIAFEATNNQFGKMIYGAPYPDLQWGILPCVLSESITKNGKVKVRFFNGKNKIEAPTWVNVKDLVEYKDLKPAKNKKKGQF